MIEGDEVKLKSHFSVPGNSINYWFSGKVANGILSGSVFLGEYLTAKFTANRVTYQSGNKRISIPAGAPLAT